MTQELWHTSAPRGLKPGTRGFCTVVCTQGMPVNLAERLELLSGYRHLEAPRADRSDANPVAYNHVRLMVAGRRLHVLSRIASYGLDYSGRSNKFAHHVVLEPHELPKAGPAWLLAQPGFLETAWDGQLRLLPRGRNVPHGAIQPGPCPAWQGVAKDAGWAGWLAQTVLEPPEKAPRAVYLIVPRGLDVLSLLAEAVALLPAERRWEATFSTFYLPLPGDVDCRWRTVFEDTPEAQAARRQRGTWCLDLTRPLPALEETPAVLAARQGKSILPEPLPSPAAVAEAGGVAIPAAAGACPVAALEEKPPPLVVPPPLAGRRTELAEAVLGRPRRRRWLLATAVGLALILLLSAAAIGIAWRLAPDAKERLLALLGPERVAVQNKAKPQPAATEASKPPPAPDHPQPEAPGGAAPESKPSAGRSENAPSSGAPQDPKEVPKPTPAPSAPPPGQKGDQPPPSNRGEKPERSEHPSPKPPEKTNGAQDAQQPANPERLAKPNTLQQSKDLRWCRIVPEPVGSLPSQLAGTAQPSGPIVLKLAEGQSIDKIELRPISPSKTRLVINGPPENGAWRIGLEGGSQAGGRELSGEFRFNKDTRELYIVCSAQSKPKYLANKLQEHIAVVQVKNDKEGGKPSFHAFQFFAPTKRSEPLSVTSGQEVSVDVPLKLPSESPLPEFDLTTLELAVEPEGQFAVQKVRLADKFFNPSDSSQQATRYLLDIAQKPAGQPQQGGAPLPVKMSLEWRGARKLDIRLYAGDNSAFRAVYIKKARIYIVVDAFGVSLAEIGTITAGKRQQCSEKKQGKTR